MRRPILKIGRLTLGAGPRVVLAVPGFHPSLRRLVRQGADLLEARVDRFSRQDPVAAVEELRLLRRLGLPVIGTVRSHTEGGAIRLSDARRIALYTAIAPLVDAMDVELRAGVVRDVVLTLGRGQRCPVILSYHNFRTTPPDAALERLIRQAGALGAGLTKLAAMARTDEDVVRLMALTVRHRAQGLVTIAMGPRGAVSRIVFPLAGSLLTYTSTSPGDGQLPLPGLVRALRGFGEFVTLTA